MYLNCNLAHLNVPEFGVLLLRSPMRDIQKCDAVKRSLLPASTFHQLLICFASPQGWPRTNFSNDIKFSRYSRTMGRLRANYRPLDGRLIDHSDVPSVLTRFLAHRVGTQRAFGGPSTKGQTLGPRSRIEKPVTKTGREAKSRAIAMVLPVDVWGRFTSTRKLEVPKIVFLCFHRWRHIAQLGEYKRSPLKSGNAGYPINSA